MLLGLVEEYRFDACVRDWRAVFWGVKYEIKI